MFSTDGKISKICKSCEYRHVFGGGNPLADWSNTLCNYSVQEDRLRETPASDDYCAYYKPRRRNENETESHNEESGNHARSIRD